MQGVEIFHQAAITAVMQWVFKPAIQQDRPIAVWMAIPISFKLLE
jgi:outer membrane biosynthesis protein TonB